MSNFNQSCTIGIYSNFLFFAHFRMVWNFILYGGSSLQDIKKITLKKIHNYIQHDLLQSISCVTKLILTFLKSTKSHT
jgi:hypothetical protein